MKRLIGEIIRDLRKENQITQEKLAEALNVSFQSVSRWETGTASPDISLIPLIARFFNVSTDFLFDIRNEELEKRYEYFEKSYHTARSTGDISACISTMENARKEFPRNYHFMMHLAESLECLANGSLDQKKRYAAEKCAEKVRSLCQQVLENCTVDEERHRAIMLLCNYYASSGNLSEAMGLLKGIADIRHCRELMQENILHGPEKIHQLQENLLFSVEYAAETLTKIAFRKEYGMTQTLTPDEKIQYVTTATKLYELPFPDGNYLYYHRPLCWNYRRLAELYLLRGNAEDALSALQKAAYHAECFDQLTGSAYTSPFLSTLYYTPENHTKEWIGSEQKMLLYRINEMQNGFDTASSEIRSSLEKLKKELENNTTGEPEISI